MLPPHPAAAASLAAAFAADYLSWDEAEPARRGQALARYLIPDVEADPARLGWSGHGRQRADFALPGLTRPDGDRIMVDVRVRVTPYHRVASPRPQPGPPAPGSASEGAESGPTTDREQAGPAPQHAPDLAGVPDLASVPDLTGIAAAAPAPDAPGWRSLGSRWVRLAVPITLDGDRLVVDAMDEQ